MNNNVKTKQNAGKSVKTKKIIFIYGFLAWPILHFLVFWFGMNIGTFVDSFSNTVYPGNAASWSSKITLRHSKYL